MASHEPENILLRSSLDRAIRRAGAALLGLMVLCGGTGIGAAWVQSAALARQEQSALLLSNHQLADMMHDAVRSDVLGMLQAADVSSGLDRGEILSDFQEHLKDLRTGIRADEAYRGSPAVEAATSKLDAPMNFMPNRQLRSSNARKPIQKRRAKVFAISSISFARSKFR